MRTFSHTLCPQPCVTWSAWPETSGIPTSRSRNDDFRMICNVLVYVSVHAFTLCVIIALCGIIYSQVST